MPPRIPTNPQDLLVQLTQAAAGILGEANWPTQAPSNAATFTAQTNLENSITQVDNLEAQLAVARQLRTTRVAEGRDIMKDIDAATDLLYGPSGAEKENFGLPPQQTGGPPPPPLGPPIILGIRDGGGPASIILDWKRIETVASYDVEWFTSAAMTPATRVGNSTVTQSEILIGPLTTGIQYWFRVRSIRANEKGPWSDPATRVAGI